jgi:hypothetical protein
VKPAAGYPLLAYSSPEAVQTTGTAAEVQLIYDAAQAIPPPYSSGLPASTCIGCRPLAFGRGEWPESAHMRRLRSNSVAHRVAPLSAPRRLVTVEHDIDQLLAQAPEAVDSYFPGHWQLMRELERRARQVVANKDLDAFVKFLRDVAFLKQPRSDHQWLLSAIQGSREDAAKALGGLRDIDRLDYRAMDLLASVPGFGQRGGRAFTPP